MSSKDLSDPAVTGRIAAPFETYFREQLARQISREGYGVAGLSVTYCAQLPFALAFGRWIRERFPHMKILFGGTEVAAIWKYLERKERFFSIFSMADACVIGDGELAFTELLDLYSQGLDYRPIHNTIFHPKYARTLAFPDIQYQKLETLPTPNYDKLPHEKYLAPHSHVYYTPSRGCYWNRCTFCDYGLNFDSPTSPWRQNSLRQTVSDLEAISEKHKYVYLSVDVLAPATLLALAKEIVEAKLDLRWGAEIRLEKYWSPERCALLKESGCAAISVGFESGSQRILDLIDKGTKMSQVYETVAHFHEAGVPVQIMGFTGFPGETHAEAMESIHALSQMRSQWTLGGLGSFAMTAGSMVAQNPGGFGLENMKSYAGEDISRFLHYKDPSQVRNLEEKEAMLRQKNALSGEVFDRPWVGGVDTAGISNPKDFRNEIVTFVLRARANNQGDNPAWTSYEKLREVIDENRRHANPATVLRINGKVAEDLDRYPVDRLFNPERLRELHANHNSNSKGLDAEFLDAELSAVSLSGRSFHPRSYFLRADGNVYPFPEKMLSFLQVFRSPCALEDCLEKTPADEHELYRGLWGHSVEHSFLSAHLRPLSPGN